MKILVLNYFATSDPPMSGGQLRYFHLYRHLSSNHDVTLLSQSAESEMKTRVYSPTFREVRVPKDPVFKKTRKKFPKKHPIHQHFSLLFAKSATSPTLYQAAFDELYPQHDVIIHEFPYTVAYDRLLGKDQKPRVYNSHNHEYMLVKQLWHGKKAKKAVKFLYKLEKKLTRKADLVLATSPHEQKKMISNYQLDPQKVKRAPNGIDPHVWRRRKIKKKRKPTAFFIGNRFQPNIQAVHYIIHTLAKKCPNIQFIIAGTCCRSFKKTKRKNVKLLGKITHQEKLKRFATSTVAINPIESGAGVNLKSLECLSSGIPLFSTRFGARGLGLKDRKHYVKVTLKNFPKTLRRLHKRTDYLNQIAAAGQHYVNQHYSWEQITKYINDKLNQFIVQ